MSARSASSSLLPLLTCQVRRRRSRRTTGSARMQQSGSPQPVPAGHDRMFSPSATEYRWRETRERNRKEGSHDFGEGVPCGTQSPLLPCGNDEEIHIHGRGRRRRQRKVRDSGLNKVSTLSRKAAVGKCGVEHRIRCHCRRTSYFDNHSFCICTCRGAVAAVASAAGCSVRRRAKSWW